MSYPPEDAAALLVLARQDASLTQEELAERSGIHQPVISAIERGRRRVSPGMLNRLLSAARLRPSVPLEFYADAVLRAARRHGVDAVRVFGSSLRGQDTADSDVDLLVTLSPDASIFNLAAFREEAESILGFPVDVIPDTASGMVGAGIDGTVIDGARMETVPL